MRKLMLTVALVGLLAMPLLAQRPGGGRGMQIDSTTLLTNKGVQDELKLSDKQKEALGEVSKKLQEAMTKAFKDKDFESIKGAREEAGKTVTKIKEDLTSEQKKRLGQIELQAHLQFQGPAALAKDEVATALKLTDKQKSEIKEVGEETQKDIQEIMKDARGDKDKAAEARTKVAKLRKEAMDKITKTFSDEQKAALKELTGQPFELQLQFGGFRGGKGKDKKDI
jgi:hypothetical protein